MIDTVAQVLACMNTSLRFATKVSSLVVEVSGSVKSLESIAYSNTLQSLVSLFGRHSTIILCNEAIPRPISEQLFVIRREYNAYHYWNTSYLFFFFRKLERPTAVCSGVDA